MELERTQTLATRLSLLHELTVRLASARTLEQIFEAALEPLLAGLKIDRAALLLRDADGAMRFRAWRGLSEEYRSAVDGHSSWMSEEPEPRPILIDDAATSPHAASHGEVFCREGIAALAFFPLVSRGELIGKLMLYASTPRKWQADEVAFVESVAASVAFTVALTQTEQTLRAGSSQLQSLAENVPAGIMFDDPEGLIQYSNERFSELFELPPAAELRGRSCLPLAEAVRRLLKDPDAFLASIFASRASAQPNLGNELELQDERVFAQDYVPIITDGQLVGHLWTYTDVSERKRMEQQLVQSQRLDSLGSLAGSVAHDFNNLLTPILGYGEILREQIEAGTPQVEMVDELLYAAQRAAGVTQQLLAFARRQPVSPEIVDLRQFMQTSLDLLRRLLGPSIALAFVDLARAPFVRIDPTQLQQVLVNLVANARDAMPAGGELRLELEEKSLGAPVRHGGIDLQPGAYVVLTARDTGCGMDAQVLRRIFEPFFTTKEKGRGTGLGLSTCWGIVRQSGGAIAVESTPGAGTVFAVYLPRRRSVAAASEPAGVTRAGQPTTPRQTVLVVDDEPEVRKVLAQMVRLGGHRVLEAADGMAALELLRAGDEQVDLVLSDVLMPRMGGQELYRHVRAELPHVGFVFISGYADGAQLAPGVPFLSKPLRVETLYEVLERELADPQLFERS